MTFHFVHPWALLLLLAVPLFLLATRRTGRASILLPRAASLTGFASTGARWAAWIPPLLRALAWTLLVVALARPQTGQTVVERESPGISIVVAIDVSSSMLAEDFRPANRLEVAKRTTARFVRGRKNDRIGVVAFAGEALTQVPTTTDHALVFGALRGLQAGTLEDGTALGLGLATSVNRLRALSGESKVVILMSDGENNRGEIDPRAAARAASAFGIRVFTIGVGSEGLARVPVARDDSGVRYAHLPVSIDEPLLREIATVTGGSYFRATDPAGLARVLREIDGMVRSPIVTRRRLRHREWYLPFLLAGALLLLGEGWIRASPWGVAPG